MGMSNLEVMEFILKYPEGYKTRRINTMEMNDFGVMEFTFAEQMIKLNYLVFMAKFYAIVKKESQLSAYFQQNPEASAIVKVITPETASMLNEEIGVRIEIMQEESTIAHVFDHFRDLKHNYYEEYDTSLSVIKCSLVGNAC
ncbi:hypothetical protein P0082_08860 [Candidatus Haliotispira prima]|uniref:Uncharacterized protein n=1 Tax=Candidatus Haliotispira prima TaxID=3034016 RepID=A0ABY8MF45_9SPIO|nr:hypothetical protein P0082_08860 [Candidatus Haliotispira prima]